MRCSAAPMIEMIERLALRLPIVRARAGRQPEGVALPHLPRHAVLGEQGAAQDARRRRLSLPRPGEAPGRGPLLRSRAGVGLGRRRHVCARHLAAAGRARAHRRQPAAAARDRRIARVPPRRSGRSKASSCSGCRVASRRIIEAGEYLKYRQFLAGREFPAAFATSPRFYPGVLHVFRQVAPLTRFLNEPLVARTS